MENFVINFSRTCIICILKQFYEGMAWIAPDTNKPL